MLSPAAGRRRTPPPHAGARHRPTPPVTVGAHRRQVWFRDGSGDWWYVAASFTDYFKLLVTYLGLPRWQCAYTEAGLDPVALQWFRLLAPDR